MSWWNFSISNTTPPQGMKCQLNPNGALHSLPKTSGLFNTGLKGIPDTLNPLALEEKDTTSVVPSTPPSMDDLDLFPPMNTSFEDMLSWKETPSFDVLAETETEGDALFDNSLLDNFVNLKDILEIKPVIDFGESTLNTPDILNEYIDINLFSTEKINKSLKRKSTQSPDHDYATKKTEVKKQIVLSIGEPKKRRMTRTAKVSQSEESVAVTVATPQVYPKPSCSSVSEIETDLESNCSESFSGYSKKDLRRVKNNIASKRSREIRKNKYKTMETDVVELEDENEELKKKIEYMESLAKRMKDLLVSQLAGCKK